MFGLWQALREVFPGTSLHGCAFHWAQSIIRHVKEHGLAKTYQDRTTVHQLISKLLALPFLPGRDIERAFQRLRDRAMTSSQPVRDLFQYVWDQWLCSSVWTVDEWSVYKQPVRTNNDCEGWHRHLNQKAGRSTLPFYVLVPLLHQEGKLVSITVALVSQQAVIRNRRQVYVSMDSRIGDLWDKYDDHDIVCEDFLAQVGEIYGRM
ncbi:uncharacterized protein LOC128558324 [Mercenaria mercenaria]|uniref:uncharacterized protein LOC128558324 n=1 Tax=Mercenaria mercenaria TaxID=6596 RepID=UPI00234EC8B9|nr:uncharacterized protein LOC128558324 [Mercenaria mercenaria]